MNRQSEAQCSYVCRISRAEQHRCLHIPLHLRLTEVPTAAPAVLHVLQGVLHVSVHQASLSQLSRAMSCTASPGMSRTFHPGDRKTARQSSHDYDAQRTEVVDLLGQGLGDRAALLSFTMTHVGRKAPATASTKHSCRRGWPHKLALWSVLRCRQVLCDSSCESLRFSGSLPAGMMSTFGERPRPFHVTALQRTEDQLRPVAVMSEVWDPNLTKSSQHSTTRIRPVSYSS